jgi:Na+-transporting methylmalonyl-CoA/oxaloacetate decarboxylase beta subunit
MEGFIVLPSLKETIMILIGLLLAYLAITKKYEPLLLLPIGIGILLVNLPPSHPFAKQAPSSTCSSSTVCATSSCPC